MTVSPESPSYTRPDAPDLTPAQRALLDQEWPTFSDAEMARRRDAIEAAMDEADVAYLLIHGAGGRGSAVPWLTGWSVTTEVICIVSKAMPDSLFIQYFNHVPFAKRLVGSTADDVSGGTYTLSNSGSFGTLITAPIINQPQVAILSADGIFKKPVVVESDAGDSIAIRPVGVLAQSFDHRAIDGAYSAGFLKRVKQLIENDDWSDALD